MPGIKSFIRRRESRFYKALIFLHFLVEFFSDTINLKNLCHPLEIAPEWHDEAKKP
ncbi:hypothetical protein CUJ84_Chr003244 [Rhizobium leguminosarum]|uniref:Uncharacterized protein n=1 Tax=Rhizobium leguminosarum TaxID=384 RepID=A0A2K9Z5Q7_RHILE|nr:hypothetical protein CUJ84_Chr003244 [Rhizobium leguminosarum]